MGCWIGCDENGLIIANDSHGDVGNSFVCRGWLRYRKPVCTVQQQIVVWSEQTNQLLKVTSLMPEGHKTHYLAREHTAWFAGQSVRVLSPQGRFQSDARKVSGKVFDRCEAVGKHLFYCFDGGRIVHVHLGRYGKYRDLESPPPRPVGAVRMRLIGRQ